MAKVSVNYETDMPKITTGGQHVFKAFVEQEILQARFDNSSNGGSNDEITIPITVYTTSNLDRKGVHARGLFIEWLDQPPSGYLENGRLFVPVFNDFKFKNRYIVGRTGTYRGAGAIIVAKRPEIIRY